LCTSVGHCSYCKNNARTDVYARQFELHREQRHSGQKVPVFLRYITHQRRRFHTAPSPKTSTSMQTESPPRPSHSSYIVYKRNMAVRGCGNSILIYLLLILLSSILNDKLNHSQLVKNFHTFFGTRKFIYTFATARHLSLS